ncbi:hypothetical protein RND71_026618 [Anisodus tanguticus]|uniref:Uncharacterized protein n=1 Tax=Anisodus tanguticus TaxID=243964 RepID=A0AAE1RNL6_9SOLA|nr:hypothetical protein RND71_026618 [Anisodus tanguticus]
MGGRNLPTKGKFPTLPRGIIRQVTPSSIVSINRTEDTLDMLSCMSRLSIRTKWTSSL